MTPIPFILALKEAGLNIFPSVYSHFYVTYNNKARTCLCKVMQWEARTLLQFNLIRKRPDAWVPSSSVLSLRIIV